MKLEDFRGWMRGEDCLVIGCGPSAFPDSDCPGLLNKDRSEVYRSHWTMGCNASVAFCDPDFITCVEPWSAPIWRTICEASPIAIFWHLGGEHRTKAPCNRIVPIETKDVLKWLKPGSQGGLRVPQCPFYACAAAILLGFQRIGLIGVDLTDDRYPDPSQACDGYARLDAVARTMGSELVNLSPISRLASIMPAKWGSIRGK